MRREIKDKILERLSAGESLRSICRTPGFPSAPSVADSVNKSPVFAEQYARARSQGLEVIADEILAISDDGEMDVVERQRENGSTYTVVDMENVQRSRLRVDSRKWLLSKLRPDKYGDRLDVTANVTVVDVAATIREARARRLAEGKES